MNNVSAASLLIFLFARASAFSYSYISLSTNKAERTALSLQSLSMSTSTPGNSSAPMYITIGPQCCGKTTYLSRNLRSNLIDVSIDNQDGIYHALPVDFFLNTDCIESPNESSHRISTSGKTVNHESPSLMLYNKTLLERLSSPTQMELKVVLKHFTKQQTDVSASNAMSNARAESLVLEDEFANIAKNSEKSGPSFPHWKLKYEKDLLQDFVHAVISLKYSKDPKTQESKLCFHTPNNKVDLYIPEAIFHPPASALQKAISLLQPKPQQNEKKSSLEDQNFSDVAIAWGNTNTQPMQYQSALEAAQDARRPVYFIVFNPYGDIYSDIDKNKTDSTRYAFIAGSKEALPALKNIDWELPYLSRKELIKRNLKRLCETGRYVNVKAIDVAIERCKDLLRAANHEIMASPRLSQSSSNSISKSVTKYRRLDLDKALAKLAGFEMGDDRIVSRVGGARNIPKKHSGNRGHGGRGRGQKSSHSRKPVKRDFRNRSDQY